MNNPKISIIVPAYNIEKYIAKCIISIKNQTYKNIEVIIINDGSSDNTLNIIKETVSADARFIVFDQKNTGVSVARKNGINASTGEYIGFVDGDDCIEPDMYEKLVSNILTSDAEISHCGYKKILPNNKTEYYYNTGKKIIQDNFTGKRDLLSGEFIEPGLCNKLYSAKLFKNINFDKFSGIKNNEDLLLNFFLFSAAEKSVYEDFCPYNYVYRADSASNAKLNEHQLFDPLKVIEEITECVKENDELYRITYSRLLRQYIKISTANIKNDDKLKQECRKIHSEFRKMIKNILSSAYVSKKLKIMSLWVAFSPYTYMLIHNIHNKIKYKQDV